MIRGIYTGCSGMLVQLTRTDVVANNLANANTVGFKREETIFRAHPQHSIVRVNDLTPSSLKDFLLPIKGAPFVGRLGTASVVDETYIESSLGPLIPTGNPLDLALRDEGTFFVLQDSKGNRYYTRAGSFTINSQGNVVSQSGHILLSEGGPINVPEGSRITFAEDGRFFINGEEGGTLLIVRFQKPTYLKRIGSNLYAETKDSGSPIPQENINLEVGALEGSNVSPVKEMVHLIEAHRAYEMNQRMVLTQDETLERAITNLTRVA
ncbi:MAG: flagellar hook-basal body protein [Synergistetes bacterium]|nr:flagellar hook-basal body protein [Synergistota bacterium]MDW8192955.1 flagellar hook-basal body protein [Synergistota bacterium]